MTRRTDGRGIEIDFTDRRRRASLQRAHALITDGYRILRDDVGADNPADNAFLREATVCAHQSLIWIGDRGGTDARTEDGLEVEIKSTRLDSRSSIQFPTSRYVSPTVIDRFRAADFWMFAIFDLYEQMIALYRVYAADMAPLIDHLEAKMHQRKRSGQAYENNPKFPFAAIYANAMQLHLSPDHEEFYDGRRQSWQIRRRSR